MIFMRKFWRRTAFAQFLDGLEPIDRATFWVAVILAFAIGLSFHAIARADESASFHQRFDWIDPDQIETADARS